MIEINVKIEIWESRTPTLGTLSMISLEIDFVNIYYNIFNNISIIYIGILQHTNCSRLNSLTVYVYSSF